jgi:hypothetical protein
MSELLGCDKLIMLQLILWNEIRMGDNLQCVRSYVDVRERVFHRLPRNFHDSSPTRPPANLE